IVEAKLGQGAMGSVFRGRHTTAGNEVAIKVLHTHLVNQPVMLERFRREARVAARLHHENLVGVLEVGQTSDGYQLIVLELARGPSLRQLMTEPFDAERIVGLVKPILRGLEHAHQAGLIHRDLKPDNVMVEHSADGTEIPRIVDFGIAVLRDPDESEQGKLTASGVIVGTPLYMAPEQAKGESFDHRIDLFALGVTVYEMLAGEPPFSGSAIEIAIANINNDPPAIATKGVTADPVLEAFARKLMARRPDQRFATARAALDVLELVDDPELAMLRMGRMDVAKARAVVELPASK
ncbi:MAG TPA: serine/threonine-protein kinase, partial [Kofleriaceae bacterium]|nr:serine/threonine-protein kinase [Kofleriaceae bacterium]